MTATVTAWTCGSCDAGDTGTPAACDRQAERHTKTTGHPTSCVTQPEEAAA